MNGSVVMSSISLSDCSQPAQPIRILIADRSYMGSQLLAESLDRDSRFDAVAVAAAAGTTEILSAVSAHKPDVAVISADFDGSPKRGLQVARALNAHYRNVHIVILLEPSARESVIGAFRCGAKGVFCRSKPLAEFRACIERVSLGEIWANCFETEYLLEALRDAPSCDGIDSDKVGMLSKREVQVAECAAQGYSNRQIADQFRLSEHTVKNYLSRVFEKLGVSNRFELLFLLFHEGNGLSRRAARLNVPGLGNPIEVYLKAAEEGYAAAQFIVGLAHLEGDGVEKNGHSAYYWLRMAEENSSAVRQRSRALTEDLRTKINPGEIEGLERRIATGAQNDKILASKPVELFKQRLPLLTDLLAV
jgi:two-component system, NarL family, nitrate/nitrite response regulator NarL